MPRRRRLLVPAAALALMPFALHAQSPPVTIRLAAQVSATDNAAADPPGRQQRDAVVSLRPEIAWARRGADLSFDLQAGATFLDYLAGTRSDGVRPEARAALKATLARQLLYLDAAAQLRQTEVDPFGERADDAVALNRRTERSLRIAPYVSHALSPQSSLLARHDASMTTHGAGNGLRLQSHQSTFRIERQPVPLGGAVELTRLDEKSFGAGDSRFTLSTARLRARAALDHDIVAGGVIGRDASRRLLGERRENLFGLELQWNPGPRTRLSAELEHRFFGNGGSLAFAHRMPSMSMTLDLSRRPTLGHARLGVLGEGGSIRSLLDAILTTRHPDPLERASLVEEIVARRGLETSADRPVDIVADYPQLQSSVRASWALLGRRHTVTLTWYAQTVRRLATGNDPLAAVVVNADTRQSGGSLHASHRLTPQLTASGMWRWARVVGLGARAGEESQDRLLRLSLVQQLSPRAEVSAGVQRRRFATTASGLHDHDATLAFVGLDHRF